MAIRARTLWPRLLIVNIPHGDYVRLNDAEQHVSKEGSCHATHRRPDASQNGRRRMTLPLSGLTVLDLTLARAGPTCVRHLADWGASIIRVEPPKVGGEDIAGDRDGFDFQNLHRNKRTIQLDLKSKSGHAAFMRLVEKADVLIENMRAAVKHRLHIAWDDVHAVNKRLVYGSISGFGQTGPYGARAGVDQIAQGLGGLMSITGLPGQGPVRVGIPIADLTAGNLLALGVMMALFDRQRTGEGRWVHTSLLEVQVFMLDFQAARYLRNGEVAGQAGNDHPTSIPTGVFPTSDGQINIAASSGRLWTRFCEAIGQPDWSAKPEWSNQAGRSEHREAINAAIAAITRTRPAAHWVELFEEAGIPCGPINTIDKVFADPQVQHLGLATPVEHPRLGKYDVVNSAINMQGVPKGVRSAAPEPGADTEAVLREIGLSDAEIQQMRKEGAI
jgi:crotonobetainyl-CoA:carnitine CoA-transferase CaiB-like acyl-CoA transferase